MLELGKETALVEEGGPKRLGLWERVRYEWTPDHVRWTIVESNSFNPGGYVDVTMKPNRGGGTGMRVEWNRAGRSLRGRLLAAFVVLSRGAILRRNVYEAAFGRNCK